MDTESADYQAAVKDLEDGIKRHLALFEEEHGVYIDQVEVDRRPQVGLFTVSVFTTSQ